MKLVERRVFFLKELNYLIKFKEISKIITKIPSREAMNKKSAMLSNFFSFFRFEVRIEEKEKMAEAVSKTAIQEVSSSIMCVSAKFVMCKEVITKRQKPNKLADVLSMC